MLSRKTILQRISREHAFVVRTFKPASLIQPRSSRDRVDAGPDFSDLIYINGEFHHPSDLSWTDMVFWGDSIVPEARMMTEADRWRATIPQFKNVFSGPAIVEFLIHAGPDIIVRVVEPFYYVDSMFRMWKVPAGWLSDGATIPRPLWPIVGSPFTGDYRRGALPHDVACVMRDQQNVTSQQVHRMLYEAARTDHANKLTAWTVWTGVRTFGPRW